MKTSVKNLFKKAKADKEFVKQLIDADPDCANITSWLLGTVEKCMYSAMYEGYLVGKYGPKHTKQVLKECGFKQ